MQKIRKKPLKRKSNFVSSEFVQNGVETFCADKSLEDIHHSVKMCAKLIYDFRLKNIFAIRSNDPELFMKKLEKFHNEDREVLSD